MENATPPSLIKDLKSKRPDRVLYSPRGRSRPQSKQRKPKKNDARVDDETASDSSELDVVSKEVVHCSSRTIPIDLECSAGTHIESEEDEPCCNSSHVGDPTSEDNCTPTSQEHSCLLQDEVNLPMQYADGSCDNEDNLKELNERDQSACSAADNTGAVPCEANSDEDEDKTLNQGENEQVTQPCICRKESKLKPSECDTLSESRSNDVQPIPHSDDSCLSYALAEADLTVPDTEEECCAIGTVEKKASSKTLDKLLQTLILSQTSKCNESTIEVDNAKKISAIVDTQSTQLTVSENLENNELEHEAVSSKPEKLEKKSIKEPGRKKKHRTKKKKTASKNISKDESAPTSIAETGNCSKSISESVAAGGKNDCLGNADDWDIVWNDSGECLDKSLRKQLRKLTASDDPIVHRADLAHIESRSVNSDVGDEDYAHIIEIYGFSSEYKTSHLALAITSMGCNDYELQWVTDTSALVIFPSKTAAASALSGPSPYARVRGMTDASPEAKEKAKLFRGRQLPYKPRPATTAHVARNFITNALGLRANVSPEQRALEREKLRKAKEAKAAKEKQRMDLWEEG